jgi:hypothetical protein
MPQKSMPKFLYDWPFTANQFVFAPDPLSPTTGDFIPNEILL